jgi:hypothetical protein
MGIKSISTSIGGSKTSIDNRDCHKDDKEPEQNT